MIITRYGCLVVLCAAPLTIAAQDGNRAAGLREGTAVITGRVLTDAASPQPLGKAVVTLKGGPIAGQTATTTDDGRFTFTGLPAGRFTVTAAKPAYLDMTYGAIRPGGAGTPIALAQDERVDVTIRLTYGAILAGHITSQAREPLSGVLVLAYRSRAGMPLKGIAHTSTDDLGAYRIFGLPAGEYVIAADKPELGVYSDIRQPTVAENDARLAALVARGLGDVPAAASKPVGGLLGAGQSLVTYAPVYFPGVASREDATRLTLATAEERAGLDFTFDATRTATIEGSVSGPTQEIGAVQLTLDAVTSESSMVSTGRSLQANADGTFAFRGVAPGRYVVRARAIRGETTSVRPSPTQVISVQTAAADAARTADADVLYAMTEIETRGNDVKGVALNLQPGSSMTGRIRFDSTRPAPAAKNLAQIRVSVSPTSGGPSLVVGNSFSTLREAQIRADGTFVVKGIAPGTYSIRVQLPASVNEGSWWLRSAMLADRDLLDADVEVTAGLDLKDVVMTCSDRHTELSGVLSAASGRPAPEYVIVVFSTDRASWRALARRTQIVRPASDGQFHARDLPPGEYFLAALTDIDADELMTPIFFEQLVPGAIRLTIGDGEHKIQNLLIPR